MFEGTSGSFRSVMDEMLLSGESTSSTIMLLAALVCTSGEPVRGRVERTAYGWNGRERRAVCVTLLMVLLLVRAVVI